MFSDSTRRTNPLFVRSIFPSGEIASDLPSCCNGASSSLYTRFFTAWRGENDERKEAKRRRKEKRRRSRERAARKEKWEEGRACIVKARGSPCFSSGGIHFKDRRNISIGCKGDSRRRFSAGQLAKGCTKSWPDISRVYQSQCGSGVPDAA